MFKFLDYLFVPMKERPLFYKNHAKDCLTQAWEHLDSARVYCNKIGDAFTVNEIERVQDTILSLKDGVDDSSEWSR